MQFRAQYVSSAFVVPKMCIRDKDTFSRLIRRAVYLFVFLSSAGVSLGQAQFTIMEYTNRWRYLQGNSTPTNWFAADFDDSAWAEGRGILASPIHENVGGTAPINTVLSTNVGGGYIVTHYFRTVLMAASTAQYTIINGSAVIDDGAVIYVNGREVQRIGMPSGAIGYSTVASRSGEVAARLDAFTFAGSNFVEGPNLVAVEVHQDSTSSSDVVLGMQLVAEQYDPAEVLAHPLDQTVEEGHRATFIVNASGYDLRYQWYLGNTAIAGAVSNIYTTSPATFAMNGNAYHVLVSNKVSSVRSASARLTVVPDVTGPRPLIATEDLTNRIRIQFDETLLPGPATNSTNYTLLILGQTNQIAITNVQWAVNQVRVFVDHRLHPSTNYVLCIRDVLDMKTNTISPNPSYVPVGFTTLSNLISFGALWRYNDVESSALPTNWTALDYDDDPWMAPYHWAEGPGAFALSYSPSFNPCSSVATPLSLGPITYYFRKRFYSPGRYPIGAVLYYSIDDGAVFYLNGKELLRVNMPAGTVGYSTRASSIVNDALCITIGGGAGAADRIVQGTNILAVEVHQAAGTGSPDIAFDFRLDVRFHNAPALPELRISYGQTHAVLTWETDWSLEAANNFSGPWSKITTEDKNYRHAYADDDRKFFRLASP